MNPKHAHLVIRYRDPGPDTPTIRLHRAVIGEEGAVWFGKTGRSLDRTWARRFKEQVEAGVPTFLYLVTRTKAPRGKGNFLITRGEVRDITYSPPEHGSQIPAYYGTLGLNRNVSFWVLLRSLEDVRSETLEGMVVVSSGRPILSSLRSTSPTFIIALA